MLYLSLCQKQKTKKPKKLTLRGPIFRAWSILVQSITSHMQVNVSLPASQKEKKKILIYIICLFPLCTYSTITNFKLPVWHHWTQIWEEICTIDSPAGTSWLQHSSGIMQPKPCSSHLQTLQKEKNDFINRNRSYNLAFVLIFGNVEFISKIIFFQRFSFLWGKTYKVLFLNIISSLDYSASLSRSKMNKSSILDTNE